MMVSRSCSLWACDIVTFFKIFLLAVHLKITPYRSNNRRCSVKIVFLEVSQNSQENTCARASFLIKLQAFKVASLRPETLLKKRLWHRCFPDDCFCPYHFFVAFLFKSFQANEFPKMG